ncbi:putative membrane protein [Chitinophaga sp. OAE865]
MMKTYLVLSVAVAALLSCGQQKKPEQTTEKDSVQAMKESMDHLPSATVNFITTTAAANLKEIRLGQLAKKKAQDNRIRQYGAMMEKDHTAANEQLQAIANRTGVTMPAGLTDDAKAAEQTLTNIRKEDFDRAYIKQMIDDHKKTIFEFNNVTSSKDTAISNFSRNMLPKLNTHLEEANTILEDMRKQINKRDISHN